MEVRESTRRWVVTVVLAIAFAGCLQSREEEDPGPVSDEAYVQVMTKLMLLDADPPEGSTEDERQARADSARMAILAEQRLTAHEILEFAEDLGGQAGRMEGLWQQITHRYDSTRIASLDAGTEARSESEGKLGEEARAATSRSSARPLSDVAVTPADSTRRDTVRSSDLRPRPRQRLERQRPARDTTGQPD